MHVLISVYNSHMLLAGDIFLPTFFAFVIDLSSFKFKVKNKKNEPL